MNIIVEQDPSIKLVHFRASFRTGSLSDPEGKAGLCGLTARMLVRGTKSSPYFEFSEKMERMGACVGLAVDQEFTIFSAQILAERFEDFLVHFHSMLTEPALAEPEFLKLQKIVTGEIRASLEDPDTLSAQAIMSLAYGNTKMSVPPCGIVTAIEQVSIEDVRNFYTEHYEKSELVFGIVSPYRNDKTLDLVQRTFAENIRKKQRVPIPSMQATGRSALVVECEEVSAPPFYIAVQGIRDSEPNELLLEIGNFIFGGDFTSRLTKALRIDSGWTYGSQSAYGMLIGSKTDATLFAIQASPSEQYVGEAIAKTLDMMADYFDKGIREDELKNAIEAYRNSFVFRLSSAEKRMTRRYWNQLTGIACDTIEEFESKLDDLSVDKVNAAIREQHSMDKPIACSIAGSAAKIEASLGKIQFFDSVTVKKDIFDSMERG